jgi:hypothetical protein
VCSRIHVHFPQQDNSYISCTSKFNYKTNMNTWRLHNTKYNFSFFRTGLQYSNFQILKQSTIIRYTYSYQNIQIRYITICMVFYHVRTPCTLVCSFHFFEKSAAFTTTSTSKTETAYSFNLLLITYQSTCYHNPEGHNPDSYHYKHLRFHTSEFIMNTSTTCNTAVAIVSCGFVNKLPNQIFII